MKTEEWLVTAGFVAVVAMVVFVVLPDDFWEGTEVETAHQRLNPAAQTGVYPGNPPMMNMGAGLPGQPFQQGFQPHFQQGGQPFSNQPQSPNWQNQPPNWQNQQPVAQQPSRLPFQFQGQPPGQQQWAVQPGQQPPAAGNPKPARRRTLKPKPGLMPFEQAPKVRFSGAIQQVSEMPQRDGQMHVTLHDPAGREVHLSVAPDWFLQYMGCSLRHDATISGVGFQFDDSPVGRVIYVKKLVTGRQTCHLRNDEGFALWSNQLR